VVSPPRFATSVQDIAERISGEIRFETFSPMILLCKFCGE